MSPFYSDRGSACTSAASDASSRLLRVWWILYGISLLVMLVATPPFQVPDEPNHFSRTFQISEGVLISGPTPKGTGGWLPCSLDVLKANVHHGIPFNPQTKFTRRRWSQGWQVRVEEADRCYMEFANTAVYSPFCYIPHVLGLLIARSLKLPLLPWLYAARMAGACGVWFFARWCVLIAPRRWRPVFLLLLSAPIFMFLGVGVTADAATNTAAFLFVAALLNAIENAENGPLTDRHLARLTGLAAFLALCKPPYVLLTLLLGLIPAHRFITGRQRAAWVLSTLVLAFSISFTWQAVTEATLSVPPRFGLPTDPDEQLRFIREDPQSFLQVVQRTFREEKWSLLQQWVGMLGWLDVKLPLPVIWAYYAAFVFLALLTPCSPVTRPSLLWLTLLIPAAGTLLTLIAVYATFTPLRYPVVLGFQGRYFIPWGPLVAVALSSIPWSRAKRIPERMCLGLAVFMGAASFLVAIVQIIRRYYVA